MFVVRPFGICGVSFILGLCMAALPARPQTLSDAIEREAKAVEVRMIAWRRDIHQNPELGNREVRTSGLVAEHLRKLGYEGGAQLMIKEGVLDDPSAGRDLRPACNLAASHRTHRLPRRRCHGRLRHGS